MKGLDALKNVCLNVNSTQWKYRARHSKLVYLTFLSDLGTFALGAYPWVFALVNKMYLHLMLNFASEFEPLYTGPQNIPDYFLDMSFAVV